ncbi:MAG: MarR family transcriptional regulator [Ruminococcaceae bacterium]|nr:MarR family transcriptional regulator [Oscillospiraceae bacterium]
MYSNFDKERARSTFYKMIQVDRLHRSIFEKMHSAFGIHRSQHRLLMYISRRDVCPSQKDIAEHFGISSAAVAVSLKKLEESGYISRESLEKDNRYNSIVLTNKGKELVEKSEEFFTRSDFAMFENFTEDDYKNLTECLEKMNQGLRNFDF